MVQRQGMQEDIVYLDAGIHQTGDILPNDGVVGQQCALWPGFGTAGIDNLRQVMGCRCVVTHTAPFAVLGELIQGWQVIGRSGCFAVHAPEGWPVGKARGGRSSNAHKLGIRAEAAGARVLKDKRHFLLVEHEVDRHDHGPCPGQGKAQQCKGVGIAGEYRDPLTPDYPLTHQGASQTVTQVVEFPVAPANSGAALNGRFSGKAARRAAQQVAQSLPPGLTDSHSIVHSATTPSINVSSLP